MYKSLREDYDVFVKSTIKDFLTKADLNESAITNEHTKNLMEFVTSITPDRETGINLTESEMYDEFGNKTWDAVENDIQSLSTDIMDNVARVIDNSASTTSRSRISIWKSLRVPLDSSRSRSNITSLLL